MAKVITSLSWKNARIDLVAAGRTPTIEAVRIALGTGSNSTLGMHLKTWKSKQDQTQQIATKENIPEALISALKGVWERVMNQSEDRIQSIHQETEQELLQLKQEVERLQKNNAVSQQQFHQIKQERDSIVHEKVTVEQLLTNVKIEIAKLSEKLVGSEQQNQERQSRIDELHRQNQQIQTNLEHYRNASLEQRLTDQQRYEQQQKQLEQTIQQINYELIEVKHEKLSLLQQSQKSNIENTNLITQLQKLEAQHESMTKQLTDTLNELAKQTQARQLWQEQFHVLQNKYDEQNKSYFELKTQNSVLLQQSEIIKTELNEFREQNKLLADEKWILGQEKAQLYGQLKQMDSLSN